VRGEALKEFGCKLVRIPFGREALASQTSDIERALIGLKQDLDSLAASTSPRATWLRGVVVRIGRRLAWRWGGAHVRPR
jgi:hypothetical protein